MSYDLSKLSTWWALTIVKGSAWDNASVWKSMGSALLLTTTVALCTAMLPDADLVQENKFSKLGTFLNVFVGLLLGFFLSSSMTRWYSCTNSFLQLFDAVRNLQMQCIGLGVSPEMVDTVCRYGVLSARLLDEDHPDLVKDA